MEIGCDFDPTRLSDSELARERVEPLLACFQQFTGHDLPNRLVASQGLARLVLAEAGASLHPRTRALLERLADLILQVDADSRRLAELGRLCRDCGLAVPVPLGEVTRQAAEEAFLLSGGRPVEYDVQDAMPAVLAPPLAARRALVELLRNAAAAAPPGRTPRVRVRADAEAGRVTCSVADDGPGVPPERMERLGKVLAGVVDAAEGRGLFLVRQFAALWGGGVRLRSEAGQGLTATLLFRPPASPGG
jgi:signal transduction histidine kinase